MADILAGLKLLQIGRNQEDMLPDNLIEIIDWLQSRRDMFVLQQWQADASAYSVSQLVSCMLLSGDVRNMRNLNRASEYAIRLESQTLRFVSTS